MSRLLKIDELVKREHYHLTDQDECYYFREFISDSGGVFDPKNSLIYNYKKKVDQKGKSGWHYKGNAIKEVSEMYFEALPFILKPGDTIFVPVPPSKIKSDPLHDDRHLKMLSILRGMNSDVDFREILSFRNNMRASHDGPPRPTPDEIIQNFIVEPELCKNPKSKIVIIDDVLTAGAHFNACKQRLLEEFPSSDIIGVFIARRVLPPISDLEEIDFDDFIL